VTVQRIDQGMAARAARALPDGGVDKELRTRYRQLRAMLHGAGLAATYAYIASKAKTGPKADKLGKAYAAAEQAIRERIFPVGDVPGSARAALARLGEMGPVDYARASAEATAFVGWLSRLADAVWQEAGGANGDEDSAGTGGDGDA
jgi:CRISPR/Cas system CMR-associated protein Cmr5 small subunit